MKIVVLGSTGMLGGMVYRYLHRKGHDVYGLHRNNGLYVSSNCSMSRELNNIPCLDNPDFIINCIGAIKPVFNNKSRLPEAIYTNAVFPHDLVRWNKVFEVGAKIIHITTDCVYDGLDGGYVESSVHNATDKYGTSKSLGESEDCMVIRTSIIGPEWSGNKRSLIEWFLSNVGGEVSGYTNHMWNGVTTLELARCLRTIMSHNLYSDGIHHVYSNDINKYELLSIMKSHWKLNIKINPIEAKQYCNRTLRTQKRLNSQLKCSNMSDMMSALEPYINV